MIDHYTGINAECAKKLIMTRFELGIGGFYVKEQCKSRGGGLLTSPIFGLRGFRSAKNPGGFIGYCKDL